MTQIDSLLEANLAFQQNFNTDMPGSLPKRKVAMVICMDCRLDPMKIFGLQDGEVHVLRNAGGVYTEDMLRSIVLSQRLLGTKEIMYVQHTECGLKNLVEGELIETIREETGQTVPFSLGAFVDLEVSVRNSVQHTRKTPFLKHRETVRGFIYEISTGKVHEIAC